MQHQKVFEQQPFQKLLPAALFVSGALLPFELLLANSRFEALTPLIFSVFALLVGVSSSLRTVTPRLSDKMLLMLLGLMSLQPTVDWLRGDQQSIQFVAFGVVPVLLGFVLAHQGGVETAAVRGICWGLLAWSVVVVGAWAFDLHAVLHRYSLPLASDFGIYVYNLGYVDSYDIALMWPTFVGNWNKASNLIILAILMLMIGIVNRTLSPRLAIAVGVGLNAALLLSFSRAGVLLNAVIGILVLALTFRSVGLDTSQLTRLRMLALGSTLPFAISLASPRLRTDWQDTGGIQFRFERLRNTADTFATCATECATDLSANTHNFFVDSALTYGVFTSIALAGVVIVGVVRGLKNGRNSLSAAIAGLGVMSVAIFGFLDFSLNYLNVITLVAIMFGWLLGKSGRYSSSMSP